MITIDGANVSQLGDLIIPANGEVDLERFIDVSLTEGQRFKFVSLEDLDVDDPSREENGQIIAEFRLEKESIGSYIIEFGYDAPPGYWYWLNAIPTTLEFVVGTALSSTTTTTRIQVGDSTS